MSTFRYLTGFFPILLFVGIFIDLINEFIHIMFKSFQNIHKGHLEVLALCFSYVAIPSAFFGILLGSGKDILCVLLIILVYWYLGI